jgi:serine/threonine protein kinase/Tol biopolymer transport system component
MTRSPESWRRICAVLDRVTSLDVRSRAESVAEACAAEGLSVEDVAPYLDAEHQAARLPEQIEPAIVDEALRDFARTGRRPLAPGDRLGPYEVIALAGSGGMGEVYKARDIRLDRIVALKRLHADLAARTDGRLRFEREARAISALNHPHICTLFDVGEHQGVDYLVMELLEGETLETRLKRGALSIADAIEYAAQIADALAAAHRRGFVHRDLKPANIMITRSGVKLLDFGLAGLRPDHDWLNGSKTEALTADGAILGTVQYMAPEQLQGRPADAGADIFALGAVLYEMLTGRRAFERETAAQSLAAVLDSDPPAVDEVRPEVPRSLAWAIGQCVAKDRDRRWESASDLSRYLRDIAGTRPASPIPSMIRGRYPIAALVTMTAIAAAASAMLLIRRDTPATAPPSLARFEIQPPDGHVFDRMHALSADGTRIAFVASRDNERALWIRAIDGLTPQRMGGTEGASFPFWSPDERFIAFFADNALKKIELATGSVETICNCETGTGGGGTWNRDGIILFSKGLVVSPLWQVPASGGLAVALPPIPTDGGTEIDRIGTNAWPQFLPDGRHFLFLTGAQGAPGVYVGLLGGPDYKRVLRFARGIRASAGPDVVTGTENLNQRTRGWYSGGFLFFLQQRSLMAQRFDVERLELVGNPMRLVEEVEQTAPGRSLFSVSGSVLAYRPRSEDRTLLRLTWLDRSGRESRTLGEAAYNGIALSHDGRFVLASTGPAGVLRIDTNSGIPTPMGLQGQSPVWGPGGSRFTIAGGPASGPFPSLVDAATREATLLGAPLSGQAWPTDWSRDGRYIVGNILNSETLLDAWAADLSATPAKITYLTRTSGNQQDQHISPDGRWVAYASNERSNTLEVYVRPFPEGPGNWRVSTAGGRMPIWTSDGRALLYVAPDGILMETNVAQAVEFRASTPHPLFRHAALARGFNRDAQFGRVYDTTDGQRFLVAVPVSEPPPVPIVVVLNWERLLTR